MDWVTAACDKKKICKFVYSYVGFWKAILIGVYQKNGLNHNIGFDLKHVNVSHFKIYSEPCRIAFYWRDAHPSYIYIWSIYWKEMPHFQYWQVLSTLHHPLPNWPVLFHFQMNRAWIVSHIRGMLTPNSQ